PTWTIESLRTVVSLNVFFVPSLWSITSSIFLVIVKISFLFVCLFEFQSAECFFNCADYLDRFFIRFNITQAFIHLREFNNDIQLMYSALMLLQRLNV